MTISSSSRDAQQTRDAIHAAELWHLRDR